MRDHLVEIDDCKERLVLLVLFLLSLQQVLLLTLRRYQEDDLVGCLSRDTPAWRGTRNRGLISEVGLHAVCNQLRRVQKTLFCQYRFLLLLSHVVKLHFG